MAFKLSLDLGHMTPKIKQQHNLVKTKRLDNKELGNEEELDSFII
jgi:hypothetical protein